MMRGIAICFFFMSSVMLYTQRKRSRMMRLYFVLNIFFTFCFLKDSVLIFDWGAKSSFIDDMIVLIDHMCVPLTFCFFLEATKPQSISRKFVILLRALFLCRQDEEILCRGDIEALCRDVSTKD